MTDILCRWLNDDVEISISVEKENVSKLFASGYLFGEILYKYGLQDDFSSFSKGRTADSKLNNFTRLESVMKLLEIPYDTNVARAIMNENHGAATKLLYQLFIALGRKAKKNLTGVAMETMRPSAPVKLESIESVIHKERLKQLVPRQVDVNFETLVEKYQTKQKQQEEMALKAKQEEEQKIKKYQQELRQRGLEKTRLTHGKQNEVMQRIRETQVKIPKPPETKKSGKTKQEIRKDLEIQEVKDYIDSFEASMKTNLPPQSPVDFDSELEITKQDHVDGRAFRKPLQPITVKTSGDDYVCKIKRKLNEDSVARKEREKRRRRVLVEQLKAHETQEEQRREEMLVKRLMRQSQQEKRIAVQLMQIRHEKQVVKENRIFREKQYAERRLKDFEDALNREAEMCRLAQIEYREETQKAEELRQQLMEQRREEKYCKHYNICQQILSEIVDFSCKIGEYRELTEGIVPDKLFREWKGVFDAGLPLYPREDLTDDDIERAKEMVLEEEKRKLTDESDFIEYRNAVGEWQPNENEDIHAPPKDNPILGHIIQKLFNIISPPEHPPPPPEFPPFPVKACFLGKFFSGKTTALQRLVSGHRLVRLCIDDLVQDAIEAHKIGEAEEEIVEDKQAETVDNHYQPQDMSNLPLETKENQDPNASQSFSTEIKAVDERSGNEIIQEKTSMHVIKKLSSRAELGGKSYAFLKKGKQIPDQLLVDVMVDAIRQIPEGTGWVMDGFPSTISQAKVLEKALTGYDGAKEVKTKEVKGKGKKSRIAPDPHPALEIPPPKSGIDIVILFDLSDDVVLRRAEGRTYNPTTDEQFHQEFNPPSDGAYTGLGKQEKVLPTTDPSNDREQVQQRITGFEDSWSKLEKWFNRFGILRKVGVEKTVGDVYEAVSSLLVETTQNLQESSKEQATADSSDAQISKHDGVDDATHISPADEIEEPSGASTPTAHEDIEAVTDLKAAKDPKSVSPKPSKKMSRKDRTPSPSSTKLADRHLSPKGSKKGIKTGSRPNSKKGSPSPSRKPSKMKSPTGSRMDSKRAKSPVKGKQEIEEELPIEPVVPPGPEPGSEDWTYIDQPIDLPLVSILSSRWENLEKTYIETSKNVFREVRDERELIYRYFYGARREFLSYLQRPDEKEEYVLQWQKHYNEVAEDMRGDDDVKAELHQEVDDLCDRLYEICDNRKEMAENERLAVMREGWLEDRLGLLTNHYLTLMQVEVDRYQDTMRVLKDYYNATEGKSPIEACTETCRVPLVELPPIIPEVPSSGSDVGSQNEVKQSSSRKDREALKTPDVTSEGDENRHRIPLVPRRPKSGDTSFGKDKKDKRSSQKKDKGDNQSETPVLPSDPDERLIFDGYFHAVGIIETLAALDEEEQEEEANKLAEAQKEKEKEKEKEVTKKPGKEKKEKKGKKSASKTSAPKPQESPLPVVTANSEGENEEEKLKNEVRGKCRRELLAAVGFEDATLRTRVEMIRNHSVAVLQELKGKADLTYKDMDDWLGARFLQEVESIRAMANLARTAVENENKLQRQLILEDKDFVVDLKINVFRTPSPTPPPSPREFNSLDSFTVVQLEHLYAQFIQAAPSGLISCRAFVDIFLDLMTTSFGMEMLPDLWMSQTALQLHSFATLISRDSEFVDWMRFIVLASYPLPRPTRFELFDTLSKFVEMDSEHTGFVSEEQFSKVDLWFTDLNESENVATTEANSLYPRLYYLKQLFFMVFSDYQAVPSMLNYENMLMYFAMDENPVEGFLRALTIVCRQPMLSSSLLQIDIDDECEETNTGTSPTEEKNIAGERGADSLISLNHLLKVFNHGESRFSDNQRFPRVQDSHNPYAKDRLRGVFVELGADQYHSLPFYLLYQHPVIQDCIHMCQRFKYFEITAGLVNLSIIDLHQPQTCLQFSAGVYYWEYCMKSQNLRNLLKSDRLDTLTEDR